jgi:hypothetical protein
MGLGVLIDPNAGEAPLPGYAWPKATVDRARTDAKRARGRMRSFTGCLAADFIGIAPHLRKGVKLEETERSHLHYEIMVGFPRILFVEPRACEAKE